MAKVYQIKLVGINFRFEGLSLLQSGVSFVFSVWLHKLYIGSELKSKVFRWTAGRPDGYVKIMPLVAPTPQLRLRWTELSWSVGAECGNIYIHMLRSYKPNRIRWKLSSCARLVEVGPSWCQVKLLLIVTFGNLLLFHPFH